MDYVTCNVRANVAVFQGCPVKGDVAENLNKIANACKSAFERNVDLILFAELFLCGYDIGVDKLRNIALRIDSPEIQLIKILQ